jgi:hypothetical protein
MEGFVVNIFFTTRSNDGEYCEHTTIESALEQFVSSEGYRLDFHFKDGRTLSVYRSEYNEDFDDKTIKLYSQSNVLPAKSQVMYFNAISSNDEYTNLVYLDNFRN